MGDAEEAKKIFVQKYERKTGLLDSLPQMPTRTKISPREKNTLIKYLENPQKYIPETKVVLAGIKKGEKEDLIAYPKKAINE